MRESEHLLPRCSQDKCENFAAYRHGWPGRAEPMLICEKHVKKLRDIAGVLGFDPRIEQLITQEER